VKLLSGEEARVWRKALRHPRAREHFYRGMHEFMKGQREANAIARDNFEQVARLVPEASMGATHVAFTHWMDAFRGWTPAAAHSFDLAAQWAGRAMAMEDADGQAHTVMAHIHLLWREHDKALAMAEQAVTLRPACMNANGHLGNILFYCGRPADAADRIRQVMRISPVHAPWVKLVLASSLKELRQMDEAVQVAREVLRMKADDVEAHLVLIEASLAAGDLAAAQQLAGEVRTLQPSFSVQDWAERQPYSDAAVLQRIVARLREAGL
jgi:tetratricopeptide (TPR) repeat protein